MKNISKPWEEDNILEKRMMSITYGQKNYKFLESLDKKNVEDLLYRILELEDKQKENHHYMTLLAEKILKQEEKLLALERQNHDLFIQGIVAQNSESVTELAHICEIDENTIYDPNELEGILSAYSDSQSSVEWVRSVRDNS